MLFACLAIILSASLYAQTNLTFQYFYDDLGQLTKVVDSTGNVVEYVYDPVGNILQIKRSTIAPGSVAIFGFTPQQGSIDQSITIQGQGFSSNPGSNIVQFSGTATTVVSATPNTLVALVPQGATTGLISVTVGTQTATSSTNFTVIPSPVIASMTRKSALFNTTIPNLGITGFNLNSAAFAFQPTFSTPAIGVTSASTDPSGLSAALSIQTGKQAGTFALVGTNSFGSSSSLVTKSNRFTVVDPRSTADSTGTGIPDVIKATFGADPLDPNSIPPILPVPEAESLTVSVLNGAAPPHTSPAAMEADSLTVSLLNGAAPFVVINTREADSLTVSLLNGVAPPRPSPTAAEADSLTVSLLNGIAPPSPATHSRETDSLTVSLLNGTAPPQMSPLAKEADSLTVSLLNGVAPPASSPTPHEVDGLTTSLLNGIAPPVQPTAFEADSLTISLSNSAPKTMNGNSAGSVAYAPLNQHPQNLPGKSSSRKRSSAKPKPRKRTQSNEGD